MSIYRRFLWPFGGGRPPMGTGSAVHGDGEPYSESLFFPAGKFMGSHVNWTTFGKEAFVMYDIFQKMEYMLILEEMAHIFTSHSNELSDFNWLEMDAKIALHFICRSKDGGCTSHASHTSLNTHSKTTMSHWTSWLTVWMGIAERSYVRDWSRKVTWIRYHLTSFRRYWSEAWKFIKAESTNVNITPKYNQNSITTDNQG